MNLSGIRRVFTALRWHGGFLSRSSHESNDYVYYVGINDVRSSGAELGGRVLLQRRERVREVLQLVVIDKLGPSRRSWREVKRREKGL